MKAPAWWIAPIRYAPAIASMGSADPNRATRTITKGEQGIAVRKGGCRVESRSHHSRMPDEGAVGSRCVGTSNFLHSPNFRMSRLAAALLIIAALATLAWLLIDWEWSTIDDPGHVLALQAHVQQQGRIAGAFAYMGDLIEKDRSWALFRPSYWVYPAIFYQLPVAVAHAVRLLMVILAIAGPIIYFRRNGASRSRLAVTALLVFAAGSVLYQGLFLVSLQELSGAAFVGLGLLMRRSGWRVASWTVAAWFKAPFAWLLVGEAVVLWRRGERRLATVSGLIGAGTLVVSAIVSRGGTYTGAYSLDPVVIASNVSKLAVPSNVLLLVSVVWWLAATQTGLQRTPETLVFGVALIGYTVQLLPWMVDAYYMGPISYFLGLALVSLLTQPSGVSGRAIAVGLVVPAVVALALVAIPLRQGLATNAVLAGLSHCLADRPTSATVILGELPYVTTSMEGPIRIAESVKLRNPKWTGTVQLETPDGEGLRDPSTTLYAVIGAGSLPAGRGAEVVCQARNLTVYELGS